jgi:serine/threonine protein kinase
MAPELLRNPPLGGAQKSPHAFNSATDIWAFGVLLWELFTCGQQPYAEMHADEFAQVNMGWNIHKKLRFFSNYLNG